MFTSSSHILSRYFLPPQVTNPAIDPLREAVVTSLRCFIGPEKDITSSGAAHAARLDLMQVWIESVGGLCAYP